MPPKKSSTKETKKEVKESLPSIDMLDSKEEFFKAMAEKIKAEAPPLEEQDSQEEVAPIFDSKASHYKKMFFRFSFLFLVLVVFIFYFSILKLTIIVHTDKETFADNLTFYAYFDDKQINLDRAVSASVNSIEIQKEDNFLSSGEKRLGGEIIGKVTIINEYNKNQPLVATTRLLSSDDKLFRIKNTVNVPAGGSVEVDIYADTFSEDMAIMPTRFTIPGLWAGLQDKIYAESYEKFELKQDSKKYITQADIDSAIQKLNKQILEELETRILSKDGVDNIFNIDKSLSSIEMSHELGDETESFNLKIKNTINIIGVESNEVSRVVRNKLDILDFNKESSDFSKDNFTYTLLNYNPDKSLAELRVDYLVENLFGSKGLIDKTHLTNLNEKQIQAYLNKIPELKDYDLIFYPNFFKRSSLLSNRIIIEHK